MCSEIHFVFTCFITNKKLYSLQSLDYFLAPKKKHGMSKDFS